MIYKVKNISAEDFSFEGTFIPAGKISGELTLEVFQRILALYYNVRLIPLTENELAASMVAPVIPEGAEVLDELKPGLVACSTCLKEFGNEKGLKLHMAKAHQPEVVPEIVPEVIPEVVPAEPVVPVKKSKSKKK